MMIRLCLSLFIMLNSSAICQEPLCFDDYFINKTMRLDYIHSGIHDQEVYSYDEIYQESIWPGSIANLIDTLNLGKYIFQVYDSQTNRLIYSRGFCSIFGEWQTTDEASQGIWRSFSESARFPWPKKPVRVTIGTRNKYNHFEYSWSVTIDPDAPNNRKSFFYQKLKLKKLINNGDPHTKLDIVILPDGYRSKEMKKFKKDANRLLNHLFSVSPFKERIKDFNVWAVEATSAESGIDNPQKGDYVDNILSCSYNSFGSDRYILTWDNKTVRKIAARAPYDQLYILVNSEKYGGGGIFNLYSTCISNNPFSNYIFVHEFGHTFGGLADEYYTSSTAYTDFYPQGIEPWEPNITALLDKNHPKWEDLIEPETLIPTPWEKGDYDTIQFAFQKKRREMRLKHLSEDTITSIMAKHDHWAHEYLHNQKNWGKIGIYEGAGYASNGLYRPFLDCRMFSRGLTGFCPVCSRAIEKVIDFYIE